MDNDEKLALKAACIQAAATLLAPYLQPSRPGRNEPINVDTGNCARHARDLFGKLTGESWD